MNDTSSTNRADFIDADTAGTLPGLFQQRVQRTPQAVAYRQFDTTYDAWRDYTWQEMQALVGRWQVALAQEGLVAEDRVAILLHHGVDWVCFDQAALGLGLVVVPLYSTDSVANYAHILADSGARLLLVADSRSWLVLAEQQAAFPQLQRVVCLQRDAAEPADAMLRYLDLWLPTKADAPVAPVAGRDVLATIIYTSGTTGRPKGVMLSHHNILWNAEAVQKINPVYADDVFLSFLPLAHSFARTADYYLPMMGGACVAYARSIEQLREDLLLIRPSVLLSVPRIYERVYLAVEAKLAHSRLAGALFRATISIGQRRFEAAQGRTPAPEWWQRAAWAVLRRLVADKILGRLGGRIRLAVTGGAPMNEDIARVFLALGLPLVEGYGLTEAAPVVSGNRPEDNLPGSVGGLLPGLEACLGPDDELWVRSPGVMLGYWQRPEATRAAVDAQGWLHTGDIAELSGGHLFIRGRQKDQLVTSTGENVSPTNVEMAIVVDPLFEQALVVGAARPYLAALLVLNREAWSDLCTELGLDPEAAASLGADTALDAVLARLEMLLQAFPRYAQIRAVHLSLEPWTIENGRLTPTMKLKRATLETTFRDEISALYSGHAAQASQWTA
ncbi:MAG: long-chain fatty acid--CoA ligase [Sedimenticolaceae bacterium]